MNPVILEFLKESNAIEGVYEELSLEDSIKAWEFCIERPKLTSAVIRQTHKILMRNQDIGFREKGAFRNADVFIGGEKVLLPCFIVPKIDAWCRQMQHLPSGWKEMHVAYEKIHPFIDGNGRTGRIFMNWHRARLGLSTLIILELEKQEYYKWFSAPTPKE